MLVYLSPVSFPFDAYTKRVWVPQSIRLLRLFKETRRPVLLSALFYKPKFVSFIGREISCLWMCFFYRPRVWFGNAECSMQQTIHIFPTINGVNFIESRTSRKGLNAPCCPIVPQNPAGHLLEIISKVGELNPQGAFSGGGT